METENHLGSSSGIYLCPSFIEEYNKNKKSKLVQERLVKKKIHYGREKDLISFKGLSARKMPEFNFPTTSYEKENETRLKIKASESQFCKSKHLIVKDWRTHVEMVCETAFEDWTRIVKAFHETLKIILPKYVKYIVQILSRMFFLLLRTLKKSTRCADLQSLYLKCLNTYRVQRHFNPILSCHQKFQEWNQCVKNEI
jgi:hypothetical protein